MSEDVPKRRFVDHGRMGMAIEIAWLGGNCPVQAEGTVAGQPFYFRARGEHWSLSVGGDDVVGSPLWFYEEEYGDGPYDAGWMPEAEARGFIAAAANKFLAAEAATRGEILSTSAGGSL